ncbi:MAG TPA: CPBP family intramembrane metalloprotease, partial [Clostridiales bacterium]|nr:CPBP family intramembrane metalloprotease [Clostridiales bacterium]
MRHLKMILLAIVPFIAAVILQNVILAFIYVSYHAFNNYMSDEISYTMGMMAAVATGLIYALWYRAITRASSYEGGKEKIKEILRGPNIVILISLAIGSQFFVSGVMNLIQPLFESLFTDYSQIMDQLLGVNLSLVLIYTIIIAPITEELIFRGVILYYCRNNSSFVIANICQGVLFGLYHGNVVQGIYATLLGLLLGYVRIKYKTITAPILLHIMINASALLLNVFPGNTLGYVIMTLIGGNLIVRGINKIQTK